MKPGNNSFNTLSTLDVDGQEYYYFSLARLAEQNLSAIHRLPFSLKILLENILRFERGSDDAAGDTGGLHGRGILGRPQRRTLCGPSARYKVPRHPASV